MVCTRHRLSLARTHGAINKNMRMIDVSGSDSCPREAWFIDVISTLPW